MKNEKQSTRQANDQRLNNPAEALQRDVVAKAERERRGLLSSAVGWLGGAFDRCQLDKREAEERRRRFM